MSSKSEGSVSPLQGLLDSVLSRLDVLETKVGIGAPAKAKPSQRSPPAHVTYNESPDSPSVTAYDVYVENSVNPLAKACDDLGGLDCMGSLIKQAWNDVRSIIALASLCKAPSDPPKELQPHLGPLQATIGNIQKLRLDRKYDFHFKAVKELMGSLSWIMIRPPPQTPAAFVNEATGSCDFWANKIRKEFKGKDEKQIAFCDALKSTLNGLVTYIQEHHKTGLSWNPKGVPLEEAIASANAAAQTAAHPQTAPTSPRPGRDGMMRSPRRGQSQKHLSTVSGGTGGLSSIMSELEKKRSADGSSAATGLKHVTRDQQTWRKEYKKDTGDKPQATATARVTQKSQEKKKLPGLPICEYQERGHKWVVENQTKDAAHGAIVVEVTDPKQQVYMYNCRGVTVQVKGGKCKSVIIDTCQDCAAVFESVISGCELVNCKRIQVQTTGVCPTFSIDKTDGCLVYLNKETLPVTNFVTCQSTEMNVSFPDDSDEWKELPIPEQFVHKLVNGNVKSSVSDLYH